MEMKSWILGLVLLGTAITLINSEHLNEESERRFSGRRKISSEPPEESEEMMGVPDSTNDKTDDGNQDKEMQLDMDDEAEEANQETTGLLIRETDLKGSAGILVFQNGAAASSPLLFQLRPVVTDPKESFVEIDDGDTSDEAADESNSDEMVAGEMMAGAMVDGEMISGEIVVSDNRFKPSNSLDSEEDEEDEDAGQIIIPPKRRARPTVRPKRKQSNQMADPDRESMRPTKKPRKPASQPAIRKKRRRNQNTDQNQNKTKKKNKSKNRKKNKNSSRKQRPNNKRKRFQNGSVNKSKNRRKNSPDRHSYDYAANKNKRLGEHLNKIGGSSTVTNTVTTTQTGSADDLPTVNYMVLNKPQPAPIPPVERPFWDLLGRSARGDEMDWDITPRKRFNIRSLG